MHPLLPHYLRQLAGLFEAEIRLLQWIGVWQPLTPSLATCLSRMESDSRQRVECLRLLASAHCPPEELLMSEEDAVALEAEEAFPPRGATERLARVLSECTRRQRMLANNYRIARSLAARLSCARHAERIDQVLGSITDSFPTWQGADDLREMAPVPSYAG